MIMAALALCDACIWVEVGIGKFLIDFDVTNIFYTKKCVVREFSCLVAWLFHFITVTEKCSNGLKSVHRESGSECHIKDSCVSLL